MALRPMDDIDIAVPVAQVHAAFAVAAEVGFIPDGPALSPAELDISCGAPACTRDTERAAGAGGRALAHAPGRAASRGRPGFLDRSPAGAARWGRVQRLVTRGHDRPRRGSCGPSRNGSEPALGGRLGRSGAECARPRHRLGQGHQPGAAPPTGSPDRAGARGRPPGGRCRRSRGRDRVAQPFPRPPGRARRRPSAPPARRPLSAAVAGRAHRRCLSAVHRAPGATGSAGVSGGPGRFLQEWWDLERLRDVPPYAAFVAAGRPWKLAERSRGLPPFHVPPLALGQTVGFAVGEGGRPYLGADWSFPEEHGTWTMGREAVIRLQVDGGATSATPLVLAFRLAPQLSPMRPHLQVDVVVNHRQLVRWSFVGATWSPRIGRSWWTRLFSTRPGAWRYG